MADISKITASDGVTYNIKDTTKIASTGTTQGKWYKIAEGTFPDDGERLSLLFAVSSGTDNVYSGIYNFTARTVNNEKYVNLLVYLRAQIIYTYDAQAVYDNDTWAIYQYVRTGSIRSITWTIISENINTSANPPYTLYNNATPETNIPSSYTYQTTPGISGEVGGVYQQNNSDDVDRPILLGNDNNYVFKNSNISVNPYTGNLQTTQLNGTTIGSSPKFTDNEVTQTEVPLTHGAHEILLSGTADDTTRTEEANKCKDLSFEENNGFAWTDWAGNHLVTRDTQYYGQLYVGRNGSDNLAILGNGTIYANDKVSTGAVNTGAITANTLNGATIGNPPRWEGTQAQYDALTTYDPNTIYYITDGVPGGITVINDLSDVSISSPQNGQTLTYNSTSQMWSNTTLVKSDTLSNCTTDSVGMVNNYYPSMTDRVILNAVKLRTVGTSDYAYVEYMPNSTDANYILLVKTRDGAAYASQSGFSIKYWYISI